MLSRVADSLYWMSRYLERAEHTARLLDVNLHQLLEQASAPADRRIARLIASLRVTLPAAIAEDPYALTSTLTFDAANPDSIVAAIATARENARQVREQISSEMWEQINRLYLHVRRAGSDADWRSEPQQFYIAVKEGAHLFQGITDATMSHDEGWQFIQVGRFMERASATAALLNVHFAGEQSNTLVSTSLEYLDWVGMLKSCTAFEAYCKVYTAEIHPERIAEFLLLNAEFPRSVRFAADAVQRALHVIARTTSARNAGRVDRLAGRLRATLDYGQVDEIMLDMQSYIEQLQRQFAQIHSAVNNTYVSYPADSVIGA
ncbi:MAG: alpha-E domain-containing protein [Roseiflexaceae bacterium]|nr:alpha-E domain-containing protein [Roseiflexaceae bacterium]